MNQFDRNRTILRKYIPEGAVDVITRWIEQYDFKLKIKKPRSSKQGDYTPPQEGKNHIITINRNLNRYAFLLTLLHEIAHLFVYEKHIKNKRDGKKIFPHGKEWKAEYARLLKYFFPVFPEEIQRELREHIQRPTAASCSDLQLSRVLHRFDDSVPDALAPANEQFLEKIPRGTLFRIVSRKKKFSEILFIKGEKIRTRYSCIHARTKQKYFIHPLCRVVPVKAQEEML